MAQSDHLGDHPRESCAGEIGVVAEPSPPHALREHPPGRGCAGAALEFEDSFPPHVEAVTMTGLQGRVEGAHRRVLD